MYKNNKKYIKNELIGSKDLLDNINGYSLDYNQRLAVISDEENNLIIAGAGSGKTLTIIGKIRYLIERKNINEKDILCISFTNNTVNDLKLSIRKNYNYNVEVYTFHKLALNIIYNSGYKMLSIAPNDMLDYIVNEYFFANFGGLNLDKNIVQNLKQLICTFINLFKSNNYENDQLDIFICENDKLKDKDKRKNNYILLNLIKDIYLIYQEELTSTNLLDFNDMINLAIKNVYNSNINYKYIIIDEYQDTSITRYELINKIKTKCNARVMAVGDDFQSIYRFTGCNLDIFLNFSKYFGKTKNIKIVNTYRNSKELINVAGSFVMKNKRQMYKILKSDKRLYKPVKILYYDDLVKTFINTIENIGNNILVLGRNNKDIDLILNSKLFILDNDNLIYIKNRNIKMRFLTVHRSKGLEEENVIVLNMNDGYLGFPNKMTSSSILNYVMRIKDSYPYEEERRLFYVALTRTRNYVYLMTKIKNESIFIKELRKSLNSNIQIIN